MRRSRFATGDSLRHLREDVAALAENLVLSRATGDDVRASELEAAIIELEGRDAELVYARELDAIERAEVSSTLRWPGGRLWPTRLIPAGSIGELVLLMLIDQGQRSRRGRENWSAWPVPSRRRRGKSERARCSSP